MTVTAYLFGFTLTMVFEGNKSEFARRLNIRRTDFNRIEKRLCAGSSSVQTLEAVLQLLCEMHISVDRALVGYRRELTALSEHPDLQQRRESILVVHEEFTRIWMHWSGSGFADNQEGWKSCYAANARSKSAGDR